MRLILIRADYVQFDRPATCGGHEAAHSADFREPRRNPAIRLRRAGAQSNRLITLEPVPPLESP
jgi:hypothetical protein